MNEDQLNALYCLSEVSGNQLRCAGSVIITAQCDKSNFLNCFQSVSKTLVIAEINFYTIHCQQTCHIVACCACA